MSRYLPTTERKKKTLGLPAVRVVTSPALTMAPVPAEATHPGSNGRIPFLRWDQEGLAQLFTANPDLSASGDAGAVGGEKS
jgi:hypothetical protein